MWWHHWERTESRRWGLGRESMSLGVCLEGHIVSWTLSISPLCFLAAKDRTAISCHALPLYCFHLAMNHHETVPAHRLRPLTSRAKKNPLSFTLFFAVYFHSRRSLDTRHPLFTKESGVERGKVSHPWTLNTTAAAQNTPPCLCAFFLPHNAAHICSMLGAILKAIGA